MIGCHVSAFAIATAALLLCGIGSLHAQSLDPDEYVALMALYDDCVPPLSTSSFPRFELGDNCAGGRLICDNGKVVTL